MFAAPTLTCIQIWMSSDNINAFPIRTWCIFIQCVTLCIPVNRRKPSESQGATMRETRERDGKTQKVAKRKWKSFSCHFTRLNAVNFLYETKATMCRQCRVVVIVIAWISCFYNVYTVYFETNGCYGKAISPWFRTEWDSFGNLKPCRGSIRFASWNAFVPKLTVCSLRLVHAEQWAPLLECSHRRMHVASCKQWKTDKTTKWDMIIGFHTNIKHSH